MHLGRIVSECYKCEIETSARCPSCKNYVCQDHVSELGMGFCTSCESQLFRNEIIGWDIEKDYSSTRDWIYDGYLIPYFSHCEKGKVFEFICPFSIKENGFQFVIPKRRFSNHDLNYILGRSIRFIHYELSTFFYDFEFESVTDIETHFEELVSRIKSEDPWWDKMEIKFLYLSLIHI